MQNIKKRAAAIVIHDHKILLMYRKKLDQEYFAIPGGTIENLESAANACLRELYEETTVIAQNPKLIYEYSDTGQHKEEYFFLCDYVSGQPQLHTQSPEYKHNSEQNYFKPMWISVNQIKDLTLYPLEIKNLLMHDIKHKFLPHVQKIKLN